MKHNLLLLLIIPLFVRSQSISAERMAKIKSSVVRITIDSSNSVGTGFFVSATGQVLTCWHVIKEAIKITDSARNSIWISNITIEFPSGAKYAMGIASSCLQEGYINALTNDYCLLNPIKPILESHSYLKLGDYSKVQEGQEIYTCGYPFGLPQQFVSKGIISTKYADTLNSLTANGKTNKTSRDEALLDLTLNKGNSGGPIVKIGTSIEDDEAIGIADFIINPFGRAAEELAKIVVPNLNRGDVLIMGVSQNNSILLYSSFIANASNGISGCVSINHFLKDIQSWKK